MNTLVSISTTWWSWVWLSFWQTALLIGVVYLLDRIGRRRLWPQARLALWSIVLVKLALPPTLSLPTGVSAPLIDHGGVPYLVGGIAQTIDQQIGNRAVLEHWTGVASRVATLPETGIAKQWTAWLFLVWLMVAIVLAGRRFQAARETRRRIMIDALPKPEWLERRVKRVSQRSGLITPPAVVVSDRIVGAAVLGLRSPTLVVSPEVLIMSSRRDLDHILAHELTHIRRRDLWVQSIGEVFGILYWFNPFVPVALRRLRAAIEQCCDAEAMATTRRAGYRETLINTARWMRVGPRQVAQLGLIAHPSELVDRVWQLGRGRGASVSARRRIAAVFGVAFGAVAIPMAPPDLGWYSGPLGLERPPTLQCAGFPPCPDRADSTPERVGMVPCNSF